MTAVLTSLRGARVAFRADASAAIGSGHVMRCLALAGGLRAAGARCRFVMREEGAVLAGRVREAGFKVDLLAVGVAAGLGEAADAAATVRLLSEEPADWLVVDHYGLGARWETALRGHARSRFAIDDLAERAHDCEWLLDQNLGRQATDYQALVAPNTHVLVGPTYALLRPEFPARRRAGLAPRDGGLRHLVVSLGGGDSGALGGAALKALARCALPPGLRTTLVLGSAGPAIEAAHAAAERLPGGVDIQVGVRDMSALLATADLAVGAAGISAWERCCLGVPSLLVVLADNQVPGARALEAAGAAAILGVPHQAWRELPGRWPALTRPAALRTMSAAAAAVTDGDGVARVCAEMERGLG